jgi:hypothetical protein
MVHYIKPVISTWIPFKIATEGRLFSVITAIFLFSVDKLSNSMIDTAANTKNTIK